MNHRILLLLIPFALAGCEQLGIDDPVKVAQKRDAEGRAVGSACRHSGLPLLDCYEQNRKESKAAIFAGWLEMDGYMRENKIDTARSGSTEETQDKGGGERGAEAPAKSAEGAKPAEGGAAPGEKTPPAGKKTVFRQAVPRLA